MKGIKKFTNKQLKEEITWYLGLRFESKLEDEHSQIGFLHNALELLVEYVYRLEVKIDDR